MRWLLSGRPLSNEFLHGGKWSLGRIRGFSEFDKGLARRVVEILSEVLSNDVGL